MPKLIVLPAGEDQVSFKNGQVPGNAFEHDFSTAAEADAYVAGLDAMWDCADLESQLEVGLTVTVKIDGEITSHSFGCEEEKAAFLQGMTDGDGFSSPATIREGDEEFEGLSVLLHPAPGPR